jgi:hypothetical protein
MKRIIVPSENYHSEQLSPGVTLRRLYPGGKDGPNGELLFDTPGGQGWSESLLLGDEKDAFQLMLPDIRLPANQYWPLHWHDCWTAVVVIEGECLIGDWWMKTGDVFITEPSLEYGPLVIGPHGCRLFEIFAQAHLAPGGYALEYRDHPTLEGTQGKVFLERSLLNKRNDGRQALPCDGVKGISKSRLAPGMQWELGDREDPERSVLKDTRLAAGQRLAAHSYGDWHGFVVLNGALKFSGRTLQKDDMLLMQPNSRVGDIEAGADGAQLLEMARTARGMTARPAA